MATKTGASGVVKVQVSGTTVAVVGEVRSFTFEGSADTIEDSVIGDTARTYKQGLATNTVSIECYWDEADAQQLILDERAVLTLKSILLELALARLSLAAVESLLHDLLQAHLMAWLKPALPSSAAEQLLKHKFN